MCHAWDASSSQGPMWAIKDSVPCSRASQHFSESLLLPSHTSRMPFIFQALCFSAPSPQVPLPTMSLFICNSRYVCNSNISEQPHLLLCQNQVWRNCAKMEINSFWQILFYVSSKKDNRKCQRKILIQPLGKKKKRLENTVGVNSLQTLI